MKDLMVRGVDDIASFAELNCERLFVPKKMLASFTATIQKYLMRQGLNNYR
jgi:hypothetical protein